MRTLRPILLLAALSFTARPAVAALTDSEKAQIQGFVRGGEVGNAARVRALVARPDLGPDEASAPLAAGYAVVPFDEAREKFTRELLLGPGSAAARSDLAPAIVIGLLARASKALASMPAMENGPDAAKGERLTRELVRIHRFVDETIANAGHPPADGHDAGAGIRDDALGRALEAYKKHVEANPKDLGYANKVPASLVRVRAATALALIDLARGIAQRHEVSAMLGLTGARKAMFERHGTLIEDGGTASEPRLAQAVAFLGSVPRAADGLELWMLSKAPTIGISSRRKQTSARVVLGSSAGQPTSLGLWLDDVEPSAPDRELAEVAYSAAWVATRAAFEKSPDLRAVAARIAERASRAGDGACLAHDLSASVLDAIGTEHMGIHGASPELFTAHALRLVMLDAPRALDSAVASALDGRDEPLAAFMLALSVLAMEGADVSKLAVGSTKSDGGIEPLTLTDVEAPGGLVSRFTLGSDKVDATLTTSGNIEKVRWNGMEPRLSRLAHVRFVPKPGDAWVSGDTHWEKLSGAPLGLAVDDGRFVLGSPPETNGFDAVVTGAAGSDQAVHARLAVTGRGGGLLVRGQPGTPSYDGIALLVSAEGSPKATLILVDGKAKAVELSPPLALADPPSGGYAVTLAVKGKKVTASVEGKKLEATLTRAAGTGRVGLMVAATGRVQASDFGVGPFKPAKKAEPKADKKAHGKKTK